ncbi:PilN domain-containing protein [Planctomycetota bacterium]
MKEIDFLPDWYRTGQKRQVNYRMQCIVLSGVFLVMVVWSLATNHSISNVKAGLTQMTAKCEQAENDSAELAEIKSELKELQGKIQSIEEIDSQIDVASVLAEISCLIDEMVVLSKIEFIAEKPEQNRVNGSGTRSSAVVRIAQAQLGPKKNLPLGRVRCKVSITGVAADASGVAELVSRLEESAYFRRVVLSFSRNTQVGNQNTASFRDVDTLRQAVEADGRAGVAGGRLQVSEFQINCYLGNYREL